MCLTVPRKVIKVEDKRALLQDDRWVELFLIGKVEPGDFVLAQANIAVEKISANDVNNMKQIMEEP